MSVDLLTAALARVASGNPTPETTTLLGDLTLLLEEACQQLLDAKVMTSAQLAPASAVILKAKEALALEDHLILWVASFGPFNEPRFICGAEGAFTVDDLERMQPEFDESEDFDKPGVYAVRVGEWSEPEYCWDMVSVPSYLDYKVIGFRPFPADEPIENPLDPDILWDATEGRR